MSTNKKNTSKNTIPENGSEKKRKHFLKYLASSERVKKDPEKLNSKRRSFFKCLSKSNIILGVVNLFIPAK